MLDLREPVDDRGDFLAELALDVGKGEACVLDDVVHEAGDDRRGVELQSARILATATQ